MGTIITVIIIVAIGVIWQFAEAMHKDGMLTDILKSIFKIFLLLLCFPAVAIYAIVICWLASK